MAYSDFNLKRIRTDFGLKIVEAQELFASSPEVAVSPLLSTLLKQNVPLAMAIGTEKASSELIIVNLFLEVRNQFNVSFFSGIDFTVDKAKGYCDFIISKSPEQFFLDVPVLAVVEAKNEKIVSGLGQCVAEMLAAQIYNEREGHPLPCIYGAVTTGHVWKFLKLVNQTAYIDSDDYYINAPQKIVGILASMVGQT